MGDTKTSYKDKVAGFKDRVTTEPSKGTIQKVVPVKNETESKGEIQLGVFISKDLMKRLKLRAITDDKTVKDIVNEILEKHV